MIPGHCLNRATQRIIKTIYKYGLKAFISAIKGISKNINVDSVGLFDVAGRTASLGLAMMKTNFIVEITNLPDKLKMQLLTSVTDKVIEQNKNTLINQSILINAQDIIALERIGALRKFSSKNNNNNVEYSNTKINIDSIYKEFNDIKFDKNQFKTQLLDLLKDINTSYSEQINYYKDSDYHSGTNISKGIEKSQTTFSDKLTSDWDNFIDNTSINEDKSIYYLPASNHNVIDTVA